MRALILAAVVAPSASAQTIGFENFAPPGSSSPVTPAAPYTESGFTITPANTQSAVFDSADFFHMPGDTTDWFGFQEQNVITLARAAGGTFDLSGALVGPTTVGVGPATITITGYHPAGAASVRTLPALTTATFAVLNWTNLTRVEFLSTDDAGLDNITITSCYPNCDHSSSPPVLNVNDFNCFFALFAAGDTYANCDGSTNPPTLNVNDFTCFLNRFAAGCS